MNIIKIKARLDEENIRISNALNRKLKHPKRITIREVKELKDILGLTNKEAIDIFLT